MEIEEEGKDEQHEAPNASLEQESEYCSYEEYCRSLLEEQGRASKLSKAEHTALSAPKYNCTVCNDTGYGTTPWVHPYPCEHCPDRQEESAVDAILDEREDTPAELAEQDSECSFSMTCACCGRDRFYAGQLHGYLCDDCDTTTIDWIEDSFSEKVV